MMRSPYHAGEIAVQERAGERSIAERRGSMLGDRIVDGARAFLTQQSTAAVAAVAPDGSVWASVWCAAPGFLNADAAGETLEISATDRELASDIVRPLARAGDPLGMVVIDFSTRRRLRINGVVTHIDSAHIELRVRETFGNCIKYIQRREQRKILRTPHAVLDRHPERSEGSAAHGDTLDADRRALIERTDTMFVGSVHAERGLDASHRGGQPGFVHISDERTLRVPDYAGNSMYQTLGNFEADPRASLAFVDFDGGRLLSITGRAENDFGTERADHPTGGTGRYWTFTVDRWVQFSLPSTCAWKLIERSPFNPPASR